MTIMDHLPFTQEREIEKSRPELNAPALEWMKQLELWRDAILQAENELSTSDDTSEMGFEAYGSAIHAVDSDIGEYAEYVAKQPQLQFAVKKGKHTEPLSPDGDFWRPLEQFILIHALEIFDHTRTENSRALVEALLRKYADEKWWPKTAECKESYEAILTQSKEKSPSSTQ